MLLDTVYEIVNDIFVLKINIINLLFTAFISFSRLQLFFLKYGLLEKITPVSLDFSLLLMYNSGTFPSQ